MSQPAIRTERARRGVAGSLPRVLPAVRRLPLTTTLLGALVVVGVSTRALWEPLQDRPLADAFGYGLPAFQDARLWTLATGTVIALHPGQYVPILLGLAVLGGFAEWRLGAGRAAVALLACHVAGVVLAAALIFVLRAHAWLWPNGLATDLDAGPSAGFLGAAAAATATVSAPMRGRIRVALSTYGVLSLVHIGALADLEHAVAITFGLALGPVLCGRRPRVSLRPLTRRDYRLLASAFFVVAGVEGIFTSMYPVNGPLALTVSARTRAEMLASSDSLLTSLVQAALWFWLARALYQGRRWAWRWAVGLLALAMLSQVVVTIGLTVQHESGYALQAYELAGNSLGMAVLVAGRRTFANPTKRRARRFRGNMLGPADEDQRRDAVELLQHDGGANNLSWMTTWPENRWCFTPDRAGYVAYRVHAGVAVGLCDPVAATPALRAAVLRSFADQAGSAGLVPCLFSVTAEAAGHAATLGWRSLRVAEEAVVDLPSLQFTGKAWQDVRTGLNQAAKLGITWRLGPLSGMPRGIQLQISAISAEWVEDKGLPELGFTLGGVDEAMDPHVQVGLAVDAEGTVNGITSWMPVHAGGSEEPVGWTLDVMRRLPGGFRYAMEFLIASACLSFKEQGCRFVSLSGAPLATAETGEGGSHPLDPFLAQLGASLEPHYGFRSLHAFKTKFQPRFEPLYLIFPDDAALPRIGVALTRAYLPEAGLRDVLTLARSGS
ncbi:MAG TPA: DUF2156 domain-containing protein [Dermatophilaceae bacterium]|nr:DUF2156 domain-containing protein [Dermatophilaceae bacterium]